MSINKIAHNSPSHANPSELESSIAQALYDLEQSVSDLKSALRPLQFHSAKEVITMLYEISQSPLQTPGGGEGRYGNANGGDVFSFAEGRSRLDLERRLLLSSSRSRCWMVSTKFSRGSYSTPQFYSD